MKNKSIIMAAAVAALVSFASSVQALPFITGGISFSGDYTANNPNLSLATSIGFGSTVVAGGGLSGANGSFTGLNGAVVTMFTPISVNPAPASVLALWNVGGITGFTFDALSLVQSATTSASLTLTGTGVIKKTGFNDTTGTWIATFNTIGETFSWSSSAGANRVPDGGTTVMLLGAALSGLCLIRRKVLA